MLNSISFSSFSDPQSRNVARHNDPEFRISDQIPNFNQTDKQGIASIKRAVCRFVGRARKLSFNNSRVANYYSVGDSII